MKKHERDEKWKDGADEERDKRGGGGWGGREQREVTAAAEITDWK